MKLYVLIAFLVFCTIQNASADWRDELKQKHINRLAIFVKGMETILEPFSSDFGQLAIKWLENGRKIVSQMGEKWTISSRTSVRVKNTPGARQCFNIAHEQHEELIAHHRSEIELCIAPNVEKPEATACCEKARKAALKDGTTITNIANKCIAKS